MKHEGFLPGDQVKVIDNWNSRKPPQIGVVIEVVPSGGVIESERLKVVVPGGVTWRWGYEAELIK